MSILRDYEWDDYVLKYPDELSIYSYDEDDLYDDLEDIYGDEDEITLQSTKTRQATPGKKPNEKLSYRLQRNYDSSP